MASSRRPALWYTAPNSTYACGSLGASERALQAGNRAIGVTGIREQQAEVAVGFGVGGLQVDGGAQAAHGGLQLSSILLQMRQSVPQRGIGGRRCNGGLR